MLRQNLWMMFCSFRVVAHPLLTMESALLFFVVVVNIYASYLAVRGLFLVWAILIGWDLSLKITSVFSFEVVASGKHQPVFLFHVLLERIHVTYYFLFQKCRRLSSYLSVVMCDANQTEWSAIQGAIMQVVWNYKLSSTTINHITNIYSINR